jgi:hypothetical protein
MKTKLGKSTKRDLTKTTLHELMMTKKYIKPRVEILDCNIKNIICGSCEDIDCGSCEDIDNRENDYRCGGDCKFWHFCLDREWYRHCSDKELKQYR